jgi:uncharacterized protein (DUF1697 family)
MKKYVALLRAINVGGTRIIKMDHLRKLFESFGLSNVQTYIQTGNVIQANKWHYEHGLFWWPVQDKAILR